MDTQLRVLREDGSIIRNLFAAGELLGSAATMGRSFAGGMLLMPSISFGKCLGQTIGIN